MCKMQMLFDIMKNKKITQTQLSNNIGVSTGNISDWKSGRSSPNADALIKISKYLDVSIDYLLTGENKANAGLSNEEQEILQVYKSLSEENRIKIKERAETLLDIQTSAVQPVEKNTNYIDEVIAAKGGGVQERKITKAQTARAQQILEKESLKRNGK